MNASSVRDTLDRVCALPGSVLPVRRDCRMHATFSTAFVPWRAVFAPTKYISPEKEGHRKKKQGGQSYFAGERKAFGCCDRSRTKSHLRVIAVPYHGTQLHACIHMRVRAVDEDRWHDSFRRSLLRTTRQLCAYKTAKIELWNEVCTDYAEHLYPGSTGIFVRKRRLAHPTGSKDTLVLSSARALRKCSFISTRQKRRDYWSVKGWRGPPFPGQ